MPLRFGGVGRRTSNARPYDFKFTFRVEVNTPSVTQACHLPREGGKAGRASPSPTIGVVNLC